MNIEGFVAENPYIPVQGGGSSNSSFSPTPAPTTSSSTENDTETHHSILGSARRKRNIKNIALIQSEKREIRDKSANKKIKMKQNNRDDIDGNESDIVSIYSDPQEIALSTTHSTEEILGAFHATGGVGVGISFSGSLRGNNHRGVNRDIDRETNEEGKKDWDKIDSVLEEKSLANNRNNNSNHRRLNHKRKRAHHSYRRRLDTTHVPSHAPVSASTTNNSNNGSSQSPTSSPIIIPWKPSWKWLPGYSGANGPVISMTRGIESFEDYLFLVGAFNNYPAIALWYDDPISGPYTMALPSKHIIQGFITAIVQVTLPFEDIPMPTPPPNSFHQKDYTLLILLSCVMVGVVLGVVFAITCHSQGYSKADDENNGKLMHGIPLKTLSGGASYSVDFRECFERAMKARHLPTHESLLMINPKEIVLSKIIGEGSFGRVWNGQVTMITISLLCFFISTVLFSIYR